MTMPLVSPTTYVAERVADQRVSIAAGFIGMSLAAAFAQGTELTLSWWQWIVLLFIAFDLIGGIASCALPEAARRLHRPDRPQRALGYAALQFHPLLLAAAIPSFGWMAAVLLWGTGLLGAILTLQRPQKQRRALALVYTCLAVILVTPLVPVAALAWIVPAFLLKIVAAHAANISPLRAV